jgi:type II secretory pathway component PulJ
MKPTSQTLAATTIQAYIRGTLARWNFQVLKLKKKLSNIQDLKEKQMRKIQQRKMQTMKALKQEQEYLQEHRVVRRRLRRAKTIRNHLQKEKIYALEEYHSLKEDCTNMTRDNDDNARVLQKFIDDIDRTQTNLNNLKVNNAALKRQCQAYQMIVDVFPRLA